MRHTILSLLLAVSTATACFIVLPIIGLFLLRLVRPELFDDDALSWALIFTGPILLILLLSLSLTVAVVVFFFAKARLTNRVADRPSAIQESSADDA